MSIYPTQPFVSQTYDQILQTLVAYMAAQSQATDANVGAVVRTFFEATALVLDNAYFQMINVRNAYYINTATGTDLDRRGTDYGLPRYIDTTAAVNLDFSGYAGTVVPSGTICYAPATDTTPQISFITQSDAIIGTQSASALCLTEGLAGNVDAGAITEIQNNPNSTLITGVTNTAKSSGGYDQESDTAYRERIIAYLTSLSQGTANAIRSALLNIPGAGITQVDVLQVNASPTGGFSSSGYALLYTSPFTNQNTDLQGTVYSPTALYGAYATAGVLPANTYNNSGSPAGSTATLTANANGVLYVDGIEVVSSDRVLVNHEATASHNGVYFVVDPGDSTHPYILQRSSDLNTGDEFILYKIVITDGNTQAGTYMQVTQPPFTVGSSSAVFSILHDCDLATTAPLTPAYDTGNTSTLTALTAGVLYVDGVAATLGKRILVKNEDALGLKRQGVYTVTTEGTTSVPYVLTRATDMDSSAEFNYYVARITAGVSQAQLNFVQTTLNPTVETTDIIFSQLTGIVPSGVSENYPGSIVVVIDNGYGSLPFSSVTASLNVVNGVSTNYATYPGVLAGGIWAFVTRPTVVEQPITLSIETDPASVLEPSQIAANVKVALQNFFYELPLSGKIYKSDISKAVMEVDGVINVPSGSFVVPAADVAVDSATRSVPGILTVNY
jgi:uncharacterized phage protein gp47/JayE